ncbi:MAG: RNA polymerase sigma factor [Isosphaeraceae bacterium]
MRLHRLASPDLGRIFRGETVSGLSEWQLLERYLEQRDELAFEAIVSRHGPMVLGVCRRMLGDSSDVDDAFQATFLVLVRRARQLGPRDAIGPWLYGVAARVALRTRSQAARHRRYEPIALEFPAVAPRDPRVDADLVEVLDQELSRLPSKYRAPLVLCYLEGRTHEEAARDLGWPVGTVKGRLARGRELLRSRLTRRGLAPSAGVLASHLAPPATAVLERALIARTVTSCFSIVAGQSIHQVVSVSITSLVEGVLAAMILSKLKWAALAAIVTGVAFTSVGVMARQDTKAKPESPPGSVKKAFKPVEKYKVSIGNTLPLVEKGESAVDPRRQLVEAARSAYRATWEAFREGHASAEQVHDVSRRWMEALDGIAKDPAGKIVASDAHLERMRDLLRVQTDRPHSPARSAEVARIRAYVAEGRFLVAEARLMPALKEITTEEKEDATKGEEPGRGKDSRSLQILAKLEEPVSMSFANETPLDDILKYIKQATTSATFSGVPIYVDPVGLQEAERSLNSTVTIDVEGVPLRRTLQLILTQLRLVYFVEDGVLVITSEDGENLTLPPAMRDVPPICAKAAKAERGELTLSEMEELIELYKAREIVMRYSSRKQEEAHEGQGKHETEAKAEREQMNLLLKEMRELIEQLKAERHAREAPVMKKSAWRRGDRLIRR